MMNANIKKMAAKQNVSMCATRKCPETEGLAFTVENTPSFFLVHQRELHPASGVFDMDWEGNCVRKDAE